jgi:hypothetical protein
MRTFSEANEAKRRELEAKMNRNSNKVAYLFRQSRIRVLSESEKRTIVELNSSTKQLIDEERAIPRHYKIGIVG